jgi:hypothetical protein
MCGACEWDELRRVPFEYEDDGIVVATVTPSFP